MGELGQRHLGIFVVGAWNDGAGRLSLCARLRCEAAHRHWREQETEQWGSVRFFVSGGTGVHFNTTDTPHAELAARFLATLGVPAALICREPALDAIRNTVEEALAWDTILRASEPPLTRLVCCTNAFHSARVQHLFRRMGAAHPTLGLGFADAEDPPVTASPHDDPSARVADGLGTTPSYTQRTTAFPMEGWSEQDFAVQRAHEAKALH